MNLKKLLVAALCVVAVVIVSSYFVLATRTSATASLAMTELQVKNMTCGSCVAKITSALEVVSGVASIEVSVTSGTSKITFDPQLVDAEKLAATVTEVGFPASVKQLLSSEQYHLLQTEESRLSAEYVGRVGDQLITRTQFEQEVGKYLKTTGSQDSPQARVQAMPPTWQAVMQRALLLQSAEQNQIIVQDGEVELRIQQLRKGMPNLDQYVVTRYGSADSFHQQLKEDMVISRNIDQSVLSQVKDPRQRQITYNQWFKDLVDNAAIVLYDPQLKQASGSAGGCGSGGGCCG